MTVDLAVRFDQLAAFAAQSGGPPLEFLTYRRRQLELALSLARVDLRGKRVLEVGGGVSGQAFLLTGVAQSVISTDLLDIRSIYGGDFTQAAAIRDLASGRLAFVCGRAESLPIADESADVVFSSYVLEHVTDRRAAAREMRRVLRRGGEAVVLVPNVMESIIRTVWFATYYWPRQLIKLLLLRSRAAALLGLTTRFPPDLRLRTHGTYDSYLDELGGSRMDVWDEMFRASDFEIIRRFSMRHEYYVAFFSSRLQVVVQRLLDGLLRATGASVPMVWVAPTYGFVARARG